MPVVGREFNSKATSGGDRGTGSFPWKVGGSEGWDGAESSRPLWTVQSDNTSPLSPGGVLRAEYPTQTVPDGVTFTPGPVFTQPFQNPDAGLNSPLALTELYAQFAVRLGPNYQPHSVGNKLVLFRQSGDPHGEPLIGFKDGGGGQILVGVNLQGTEDNERTVSPVGDNIIYRDQWYIFEVQLILNSAIGVGDGVLKLWIREPGGSPELVYDEDDIRMRHETTGANAVWSTVDMDPTFGGMGGTITRDFFLFIDHWWVSGR